ncbi:MAG: hypothetical protein RLZZ126_1065 [Pseudomonadota bacterium]|jgi:hypothetical protein
MTTLFNFSGLRSMTAHLALGLAASLGAGGAGAQEPTLRFDPAAYTTVNVTVDGAPTTIRQYKVVYVAKPIRMGKFQYNEQTRGTVTLDDPFTYQTLVISVPASAVNDQKAAIWMRVNNGGWFASVATGAAAMLKVREGASLSTTSLDYNAAAAAAALKAGYVVVDVGSRSRGIRSEDGRWAGKSPAAVVDVKAAIRYLRLNDSLIPGSSERIVLTGLSGGGALTAAVAASGNSADYLPYLTEIGAAGVSGGTSTLRDDVFAAVAYAPIQNLANIDIGYEWQYQAIRDDSNTPALNSIAYTAGKQPAASAALAAAFAPYLNGLKLKRPDGSPLTDVSLKDAILGELKQEIERQIAKDPNSVPQLGGSFRVVKVSGTPPTATSEDVVNDWLTLSGTGASAKVANIDYAKFLRFQSTNLTINPPTTARRLKPVPSFDTVGVTDIAPWTLSGESNLFGNEFFTYSNYTEWSWNNNTVRGDGSGADDTGKTWKDHIAAHPALARQIKLINPVDYLTSAGSTPAPYWYVRHGMLDRDTALAMQVLLQHALSNNPAVKNLDFKLPYLLGHTGFSDLTESFAWIKARLDAHPQ